MKFLIDAQLPQSLAEFFQEHDIIHTSTLKEGNMTKDRIINQLSIDEGRALLTKDNDFYHSFIASGKPKKLILVKLGNMRIGELRNYFKMNADKIVALLEEHSFLILEKSRIRILK